MAFLRSASLATLALTAAACAATPIGVAGPAGEAGATTTYGGFQGPESASYNPATDSFFVTNAGAFGPANDGYISIVNPDGSTAERFWVQGSDEKPLATPLGSAIHNGALYVCDGQRIRVFDLETAAQTSEMTIEGATFLNDLAIAANGTIYVSNTGMGADAVVYRITTDGAVSRFVSGEAIQQPNGVDLDTDGNVVVVGLGFSSVQVFSAADASLLATYELPVSGNDGLIALEDGFIVSSVTEGRVMEVDKATKAVTTLAEGVASAASIAWDPARDAVVVPQLQNQSVTFIRR
jgi:hypothetical protein